MRSYLVRFPRWREGGESYAADSGTLGGLLVYVVVEMTKPPGVDDLDA